MAAGSVITVQVRELVEFSLRTGDLGGGRDFSSPARALAGTRGHQRLQKSRPAGYRKEVPVTFDVDGGPFTLRLQGRIDGVLIEGERFLLEEIKTVQGPGRVEPDPLHWAQLKLYAFMFAHEEQAPTLTLRLTYLDLDSGETTEFAIESNRDEMAAFFRAAVTDYLEWIKNLLEWRELRNASIKDLRFPFREYRPGQRGLAVAVYRALANGRRLFIEAPTGIGKTVSVLFPAMKALAEGHFDRVFFLTARTMGRGAAENALTDLRASGLQIRSLTLTAREKICPLPTPACDAATCPYAAGYFDRRKPAMREAVSTAAITRPALEEIARRHQVCPHELSLDLSIWVDAIICDYNYAFDPAAYLRRHFADGAVDSAFLIDEAHNLVDRAREMFSAEIDTAEIREVQRKLKQALPSCHRALGKLNSTIRQSCRSLPATHDDETIAGEPGELNFSAIKSTPPPEPAKQPGAGMPRDRGEPASTHREIPTDLLPALDNALKHMESWLARNHPSEFRESLLQLYFHLLAFRQIAQNYDERFVTICRTARDAALKLFCLDPSFLLKEALARSKASVFFSATLTPLDYYKTLLGGAPDDLALQLPSPFPPENLRVLIHSGIRTDFRARFTTIAQVTQAIGAVVAERPGNFLVYFPSYEYLNSVLEDFRKCHPTAHVLAQRPAMAEPERDAFLNSFSASRIEPLIGFAVMGGIFGESIDLVGERLAGAVIVGVGMPQLCVERDLIRDYFQVKTGAGFDYAYTFPGMNRVLQAIGRVIRSETDRGIVLLIDRRFHERRYQRLFPPWWRPEAASSLKI